MYTVWFSLPHLVGCGRSNVVKFGRCSICVIELLYNNNDNINR